MCALFHGLSLFSPNTRHSTNGQGSPSKRAKEPVRRARRARFAIESLETRDLMSGMGTSMSNMAPPTRGVVPSDITPEFTLAGRAVSSTQVNLSWVFAAGDTYVIYELLPTGKNVGNETNLTESTASDSYSVTGLSPDTSYTFYVVDINYDVPRNDQDIFSTNLTVTTWVAAPSFALSAVPSGQATTSQVNLSWQSVPGATGCGIQYQANGSGPWITAASPGQNSTSWSVTGLNPNTPYDFEMTASNSLGTTTSAAQSVTTLGAGPPFTLSAPSSTQVSANWTDVANGTDYVVDQQAANGNWAYAASSTSGTSAQISGLSPYTNYTFKVGVLGSWGVAWANQQSIYTQPAPLTLNASLVYPAQANLSWNSAFGASSYVVYEQDASTGSAWQAVYNTPGTTYQTPSLSADSYYNFKVTDLGAWGATTSNDPGVLTLANGPTLTATPAGSTQVNLSWNNVFPGQGYGAINNYVVDEQVSGGWEEVATTATTSFGVTGLSPNATYTFKVGATNTSGTSYSSNVSALTYPAAPSLTAIAVSSTQVNLSWNGVPGGATGFLVLEQISGGYSVVTTLGSGATSYSVSGLTPGTSYEFEVAACNASGESISNAAKTITLPIAPTISATPVSSSQVNLSWNSITGATGYLINEWRSGNLQQIINVAAPSSGYSVTGLFADTTYTFQVESYNASGYAWSNTVSALTYPAAPSVTLTAVGATGVDISWNSVVGATSYVIDEYIGNAWVQIATVSSGTTSFALTGLLVPNYGYNFIVGAVNSSGTTWSTSQEIILKGERPGPLPG